MVSLTYSNPSTEQLDPFGTVGASTYDDDAARMPTRYKRAHTIQNELVVNALRSNKALLGKKVVVDLGAGTSNDGLEILSRSPQAFYLGIDYSQPMVARAEEKMRLHGYAQRSAFLQCDFLTARLGDIMHELAETQMNNHVPVVISALALHHYELVEKHNAYKLAYDLLSPGGLFILTDLFTNGITGCANYAFQTEISDINVAVRKCGENATDDQQATTLSIEHYNSNKPQKLAHEMRGLRECGFDCIDVAYRDGQLATLVAEKTK